MGESTSTGTRRRLMVVAPAAAALVLATREQGRAKSSRNRKKRQAQARAAALDAMSADLTALDQPIGTLQNLANDYRDSVFGGEAHAEELQAIVDDLRASRSDLGNRLAIARGDVT